MPLFIPYDRRYNTLRLLGFDYNSTNRLCVITLVTDQRRPLFSEVKLAKMVLSCLLGDEILRYLRLRAFTLMPDHLHIIAGARTTNANLSTLVGRLKSYTTQIYWKRSREIVESREVTSPATHFNKSSLEGTRTIISSLLDWRATLRPEAVELKNWPLVRPEHFLKKHLWQTRFYDHVIRNAQDLEENFNYIAMNPVVAGFVSHPSFYPYTGFLR